MDCDETWRLSQDRAFGLIGAEIIWGRDAAGANGAEGSEQNGKILKPTEDGIKDVGHRWNVTADSDSDLVSSRNMKTSEQFRTYIDIKT